MAISEGEDCDDTVRENQGNSGNKVLLGVAPQLTGNTTGAPNGAGARKMAATAFSKLLRYRARPPSAPRLVWPGAPFQSYARLSTD